MDLAPAHAYLLRLLISKPGLIQKQIADVLHLDKSTVNRFIDKMEKEGYLYRASRDGDNRIAVFPTNKAGAIKARLDEISDELNGAMRTLLGKDLLSIVVEQMRQSSARL